MKRLKFHYNMAIRFDVPVKNHHFTLKCIPRSDEMQEVEKLEYTVYPNYYVSRSEDAFHNECIYGFCEEEHTHFMVDVQGIVQAGKRDILTACENEYNSIFKYQTSHTMPGRRIMECHEALKSSGWQWPGPVDDVRARAMFYMQWLLAHFKYESGSTQITTTAEEAFTAGRGVCQDYAHIFLSLLRMDQIPCKYVTGMMMGEGLSHAWVEIRSEAGWLGIDPTNGRFVDSDYISIAKGRDYKDCLMNQGVFVGRDRKATQTQAIRAEVKEIEG